MRLTERCDGDRALVRLSALEGGAHRIAVERAVELFEPLARISDRPPRLHCSDQVLYGPIGVAQRAFEGAVAEHSRRVGRRADAMVSGQRPVEAHVLAGHVTRNARATCAVGIVVGVRTQVLALAQFGMALGADAVSSRRDEASQSFRVVPSVGIVAGRARHRR